MAWCKPDDCAAHRPIGWLVSRCEPRRIHSHRETRLAMTAPVLRWGLALLAVFTGWIGTLALVMLVSDAAPGAIALLPGEGFASRMPEDASIVAAGPLWIGIRSDAPGLGAALYRAGAWLVLPAGLPGCLPLPAAR